MPRRWWHPVIWIVGFLFVAVFLVLAVLGGIAVLGLRETAQAPVLTQIAKDPDPATPVPTEPAQTGTEVVPKGTKAEEVNWTQVQVGLYSEGHEVDGINWELPLGTWFAVSTANGRYEAVESSPMGVVGNTDHGWCGDTQLDCPPHALLVRVLVPERQVACMSAEMDISWRIMLGNDCGETVPVRFAIRYNDQTRSESELTADYLALAGLTQQPLDTLSEVGLFVSVRESGMSELTYLDEAVPFGYGCWDCLADSKGVGDPIPVPLSGENFNTFGPDTSPTGSSLISGVVFPLPRPSEAFMLEFELEVIDASVVWVGRYDVTSDPSSGG